MISDVMTQTRNMDLFILWRLSIFVLTMNYVLSSHTNIQYADLTLKCEDISEAIINLHDHLPDKMTLDDKCKRYAVITSMVKPHMGRVHSKAVSRVLTMSDHELNQLHEKFSADHELAVLYMTAIDGLRAASILEPPLFEIVECLKQIDSPLVRQYLEGEELNLILDLHKKISQSPGTKIDLFGINNLKKCHLEFVVSLINLFRDHIRYDSPVYQRLVEYGVAEPGPSTQKQQTVNSLMTVEERRKIRQQIRQKLKMHRRKEQGRLRAKRLELLNPRPPKEVKPRFRKREQRRPTRLSGRFLVKSIADSQQQDQRQLPDLLQLWSEMSYSDGSALTPNISHNQHRLETPTQSDRSDTDAISPQLQGEHKKQRLRGVEQPKHVAAQGDPNEKDQLTPDRAQQWLESAPSYESITSPQQQYSVKHVSTNDILLSASSSKSSNLGIDSARLKQRQHHLRNDSSLEKMGQELPDLLEIWSEVAPIYDSIPSPGRSPRLTEQMLVPSYGLSPSQLPHHYEYRQQQLQLQQMLLLDRFRRSPDLRRSSIDLPVAGSSDELLFKSIEQGSQQLAQSMTPRPQSSGQHGCHEASAAFPVANASGLIGYTYGNTMQNIALDNFGHLLSSTGTELHTYAPMYQFEEIDSLMQSQATSNETEI